MDIFGDEHSTDDEGSSDGESDGKVGSEGGRHEAEPTHSSGHRVQFAIPEAKYYHFDTDSDSSSATTNTGVQGAITERRRQPW